MNIAVIGSGWLGLPLAERLQTNGHTTFATKRTLSAETPVDILQFPSVDGATEKQIAEADVVVLAFPPAREPFEAYATDCLRIVRELKNDAHVLMISSTGVYPDQNQPATEDSLNWQEASDHRVAFAEQQLHQELGERLTILRLAGLVGPGRYPAAPMSRSGKTYAGGEAVNLIHLEDAVGLSVYLIEQKHWGTIVNGCAKEHPPKGAYYLWMAEQLSIRAPLFEATKPSGKIIDSEKSRSLGYAYRYDDPYQFMD